MTHSGLIEDYGMYICLTVLIPLLLDDPLWDKVMKRSDYVIISLNPSFAG